MGREIAEAEPAAMAVYERRQRGVRARPAGALLRGSAEELVETDVQQPALVATSLAINAALRARGIEPDYVVGHSVGEFAALGAAESYGIAEAIALVRERGLAMADAAREFPGSMAAILGLADEVVEALCRKIANVWPANYNCPGQLVDLRRDAGRRRVLRSRRERGRAPRGPAPRLGRVPLAARRACRRAPASGDRPDRLQGADRAVRLDGDREARGRAAVPLAPRRPAHRAGAVHAGRRRADLATA